MKKIVSALLLGFFTVLGAFEFDIGVSGGDRGVDGFYFSIGEYYRVPQTEVVVVERSISRDDVNVAYFLAKKAKRDVKYITELRLNGSSWWDISLRLGLNPHTLYVVDTYNDYGPPYGKAYGYSKKDRDKRLEDGQIVELVNVRFLSEYHGISPDEVIERKRKNSDHYKKEVDREKRYKKDKQHRVREKEERKHRAEKRDKNRYEDDTRGGNGNNGRGGEW